MATVAPTSKLRVDDVLETVRSGIVHEDARPEPVDGVPVMLSPTGARHEDAATRRNRQAVVAGHRAGTVQPLLATSSAELDDLVARRR